MTGVLIGGGDAQRRSEKTAGGGGRWSQGLERPSYVPGGPSTALTASRQDRPGQTPSAPPEEPTPRTAGTSASDFWPPDCERMNFCCLKPPVCDNLLRQTWAMTHLPKGSVTFLQALIHYHRDLRNLELHNPCFMSSKCFRTSSFCILG